MLIVGIKDKLVNKFVDYIPGISVPVIKRYLSNMAKTPNKSIYFSNPEDFEVYSLCEINEETGDSTANCTLVCPMIDLVNEIQVQ